jgi:hypothetical protein
MGPMRKGAPSLLNRAALLDSHSSISFWLLMKFRIFISTLTATAKDRFWPKAGVCIRSSDTKVMSVFAVGMMPWVETTSVSLPRSSKRFLNRNPTWGAYAGGTP